MARTCTAVVEAFLMKDNHQAPGQSVFVCQLAITSFQISTSFQRAFASLSVALPQFLPLLVSGWRASRKQSPGNAKAVQA